MKDERLLYYTLRSEEEAVGQPSTMLHTEVKLDF